MAAAGTDTAERIMSRQLPAPKTFAPSREDVLSSLAFFFGDPAVPEKLRDYSEHHAMTYHFPDAYYGQNTRIRDTLSNLVLKSPQEWQTSVALPFVQITGTTVEWDELRFDVRLLQRVPYEGVSRMQTSLRRRHRDRVVRRGIGMTIESDFYATDAGRAHFQDQLTSIRYCVQETCNFDTLFAYLTCGNYDFRYDLSKGLRPRRAVRTAMSHELMMYSIVQKEGLGLDKAVEIAKDRMSRYSVTPNMLVVPPQLLLYMALAPEEKIKYVEGGERAVANFEAGKAGYEARAFRGLGVFSSTPFEVSDDQDSVQMLQRSSQVGEFYRMAPPAVFKETTALPATFMDILIYDEEADKLQHITFDEALYATCVGNGGLSPCLLFGFGVPNAAPGGPIVVNPRFDPNAAAKWAAHHATVTGGITAAGAAVGGAGGAAAVAAALARTNATVVDPAAMVALEVGGGGTAAVIAAIKANIKEGIWTPLCITIARPFIEHLMMSAIMTVSGRDTGATLFGPADMQISANTSVKTIEGHYTCHTKSVITKPQNVFCMRDIMCSGYVAGGNTKWFGNLEAAGPPMIPLDPATVQNDINSRLAFTDDVNADYGSMLAFACPYSEVTSGARDQVISISERLLPWEVRAEANAQKASGGFPGGQSGFNAYRGAYGLNSIHFGEDIRAAENMEFIANGSVNNAMCILGPHRKYSPFSQHFYELIPGQGHFGPDAIPGDARWRRGESVSLKTARDSMVSLEVAAHSQLVMRPANGI